MPVYPRIVTYQNHMFTIAFDYQQNKTYEWQFSMDGGTTWVNFGQVVTVPGQSSFNQTVPPAFFNIGIRWFQAV